MSGGVMAEEDIEYESDPEETKVSLKMRRRKASDDDDDFEDDDDDDDDEEEEEEEAGGVDGGEKPVPRVDEFDGESEGSVPDYEDELEEEDCYDLNEEYVEEETEEAKYGERGSEMGGGIVPLKADIGEEIVFNTNDEIRVDGGGHEEEKKEIEPYSVPKSGAFYMHDDRFQDNNRGRNRRMLAGRKLWESKDNRKWGHDMFEELTMSEKRYGERRRSRGGFRGSGRNRGRSLGYAQAYRSDNYSNSISQNNNHNNAPKRIRGRGPRRYQPSSNNNEGSPIQNKQKSVEMPSDVASVKTSESASNAEMGMILPRKQGFTSNLSIASPPFYPSSSSMKHNAVEHKRDVQAGTSYQNSPQSAVDESFNGTQSSAMLKGKSIVDSIGIEKLAIDDSLSTARKPSNNLHMLASGSLSANVAQPEMSGHGRGETSSTKWAYQPINSNYQVNRVPPPNQRQTVSRYPSQPPAQSSVPTPDLQLAPVPSGGSHTSSPPKVAVLESSMLDYPSEYSKSTAALVTTGTGKNNAQGMGSFLYGGAHVMGASGNLGAVQANKKFSAFLPVMQFGGKNPGGMGVPAVGMAFPGYVGQPQPGLGNSEMTWLPVIAGAAGALGAQYCPPFISVDGSYHAQPSGRVSTITAASSKENKVSAELANDESGQRQKNPRRYTEMKFDQ